jgi:hypothetical protein
MAAAPGAVLLYQGEGGFASMSELIPSLFVQVISSAGRIGEDKRLAANSE